MSKRAARGLRLIILFFLVVNFEFQIVFVGEKSDCAGSQSEKLTPLQIFSSVFGSVLFPDIAIDLLKG